MKLLRIGHNNKGTAPGWHLKDVTIETPDGKAYVFECKQWLDMNEDDGQIERTLHPNEIIDIQRSRDPSREHSRDHSRESHREDRHRDRGGIYVVQVDTSNKSEAGTDSRVYLQITGSNHKTEKMFLEKSKRHGNPFERGNSEIFELDLPDLGEIKKIR